MCVGGVCITFFSGIATGKWLSLHSVASFHTPTSNSKFTRRRHERMWGDFFEGCQWERKWVGVKMTKIRYVIYRRTRNWVFWTNFNINKCPYRNENTRTFPELSFPLDCHLCPFFLCLNLTPQPLLSVSPFKPLILFIGLSIPPKSIPSVLVIVLIKPLQNLPLRGSN